MSAVLITHGHFDHADHAVLRDALSHEIPVWVPGDLIADFRGAAGGELLREAVRGARFTVGSVQVEVCGDRHAEVHPTIPGPENRAYLVEDRVLITGDEHPRPPRHVNTLVTPIDAPWLRATDLIRYVRECTPDTVIGVHDGLLNDAGIKVARSVADSLRAEGVREAVILRDRESFLIDDDLGVPRGSSDW